MGKVFDKIGLSEYRKPALEQTLAKIKLLDAVYSPMYNRVKFQSIDI